MRKAIFGAVVISVATGGAGFVACALDEGGQGAVASDGGSDALFVDVVSSDSAGDGASASDADAAPFDAGIDAGPLAPADVPGLYFWIRADQGVVLGDAGSDGSMDGGEPVTGWNDIAEAGTAHDLGLNGASPPPRRELAPAGYGGNPAVRFGTSDNSHLSNIAAAVTQPLTIFLVGHATTDVSYFFDSASANRVSMLTTTGKKLVLYTSGGGYAPPTGNQTATSPSVIVAIFNGASSRLFQSSDNSIDSLSPGSGNLGGLTIGNYQLGNYGLGGVIAELAIWSVALDTTSIRRLNHYAEARYGIPITK